jgi:hypothetical protein
MSPALWFLAVLPISAIVIVFVGYRIAKSKYPIIRNNVNLSLCFNCAGGKGCGRLSVSA